MARRYYVRVLYICNQNKHRSKTAELLLAQRFTTKSAGLFNETPVTAAQLEWADVVVVMESAQRTELARRFPHLYLRKQILSLDIPDIYRFDDAELKKLLAERVAAIS